MRSLLVVLVVVGAAEGRAMCAAPGPFVLPEPGSSVPANPTLYYFGGGAADAKVWAVFDSGERKHVRVTQLKTVGDVEAWRLNVSAPRNARFKLEGLPMPVLHRYGEELPQEPLGPWTTDGVVASGALVLSRSTDLSTVWSCSYTALRVFESSLEAPAYRVEFAATEAELRAGKGKTVIVEGRNDSAYYLLRFTKTQRPAQPPRLMLGHFSCRGHNFTAESAAIRVTALMPDGTERPSKDVFVLEPAPPDEDD